MIVILIDVPLAHWLPDGVNTYCVVPTAPVLIDDGLQLPLIPLFDCVGNAGADEF